MPARVPYRFAAAAPVLLGACGVLLWLAACAPRPTASPKGVPDAAPSAHLTGTAYVEQGSRMFLAVDVRAARVQGPDEFLPLLLAIQPTRSGALVLDRESFSLELPDGRLLPLATYEEYVADYRRSLADERLGAEFLEVLRTRLPVQPFARIALDFFPSRRSGPAPRERVELRASGVGVGYLYFRRPSSAPGAGIHRLLVRPVGEETTYVIAILPYSSQP